MLKGCAVIPILVEIFFSMLQSADMKLPRYLKLFSSSIISPLTIVSVLVCGFKLISLVLVGCILRPTVLAELSTLSVSLAHPFVSGDGGQCHL